MAHFAELDENNVVINVFKVADEDCQDSGGVESDSVGQTFLQGLTGSTNTFKRTSYNTKGGRHYNSEGVDDGEGFRGNYAGIGFTYDSGNDIFIASQPFDSWTLSMDSYDWEAPIADPSDGSTLYYWDEDAYQADTADPKTIGWVEVTPMES